MLPDGSGPLLLVGVGKMGGAMLQGWLAGGLDPARVIVLDPSPPPEMAKVLSDAGVRLNPEPETHVAPRAMVLAVKPQIMAAALDDIVPLADAATLVISIAAGWTLGNFEARFGPDQPIVRVMPNTPAAIGRGMLVACPNDRASDADRALCGSLLQASGAVAWIEDEALMDAVTAVSGSGPAYIFYLAECLEKAAVAAGLPADLAAQLARVTVSGAGELLHQSDDPAAQLRKNVTSPGGTTAAALDVLMADGGLEPLLRDAVQAATQRSRDLAG